MVDKVAEDSQRDAQRPKIPAPYVPLRILRKKLRLTQVDVCDRIFEETGIRTGRATIAAFEKGHRGLSLELIGALAAVYEIDAAVIDLGYTPRHRAGGAE